MSENNSNASSGISGLSVLGIVFIVLKLVGVIDWSWWWVTVPFWGGAALIIGILLIGLIIAAVVNGDTRIQPKSKIKSWDEKLKEAAIKKGLKN